MDYSLLKVAEYAIAFLALYITVFFLLVFLSKRDAMLKMPEQRKGWEPTISVVIPAYNESDMVGKCIESVATADYPQEKLEIIVVDDGSPDDTHEIAQSYAKKYPNVKVFRKENQGNAAYTKNYGIERAGGEIIATLDADSYIERDTIRKMLPHFESDDVAAVTAAVKVDRPKNFLERLQQVEYLYTIFSRRVLVFLESVQVTPGPFSMFRGWIFRKIGMFDPANILEDQEMAMRIQQHNYKIRSSLDANVYTEVPQGFWGLLRQRTRWHRGGLKNAVKYGNLIGPKYGDLGMIVMPLGLLAVVAIFGIIFINIFYHATRPAYPAVIGVDAFWMGIGPVHIIGAIIFVLTLAWTFYGIRVMRGEKVSPLMVLAYLFSYAYLITLFWVSAILKEVRGEKLKW